ncbi:MAG: serpin family protein [Candidatus Eisenbacteria bacterium]
MRRCLRPVSLFAVVLVLLIAGLSASEPDTRMLAKGNTKFALDLYGELRTQSGNLFVSPYSISSVLALTYAGARGSTATQMADVLNFTPEDESLHTAFAAITSALEARAKAGESDLSVANALWGQKGKEFLDEFVDLNKEHYGAGLEQVDFLNDTENARKTINTWVAKETRNRINDLLKQGSLSPSTKLALTNIIHFRGDWAIEFDKDKTEPRDFWVEPDSSVTVQMMRRRGEYNYNEMESLKALELPYADSSFSMIVLLPKERDGLAELERSLTPMVFERWLGLMRARTVIAELPGFTIRSDFQLDEVLMAMGMTDAFYPGLADFSGMTGGRELFIGAVIHDASLEVNEKGSEAAAGTAVEVKKKYPVVRMDRPFMFVIRDNDSGSILFMGRVADPTR